MELNWVERLFMNNPVRAAVQRRYEAEQLLRLGGPMDGGLALEVGCGRGVGVEIILDPFRADRVDAFDLDPRMVALARERLVDHGDSVGLWTGSVTEIGAEAATYDAVFDFGIIHHVPDWRVALTEIHRVLKPGGRFYAEEVYARFIHSPVWRRLLRHPEHDRFDAEQLASAVERAGFHIVDSKSILGGRFGMLVADKPDVS